jgi:hypothetical protein
MTKRLSSAAPRIRDAHRPQPQLEKKLDQLLAIQSLERRVLLPSERPHP